MSGSVVVMGRSTAGHGDPARDARSSRARSSSRSAAGRWFRRHARRRGAGGGPDDPRRLWNIRWVERSPEEPMTGLEDDEPDGFRAAVARAHAAWPADWVPAASFVEHLRARLPAERAPDGALRGLAVEDLYLAYACALGVAPALAAFAREILVEVDAHVARFDASAAFKDEVRQVLAAK